MQSVSYTEAITHFIMQMPGFVAWKTPDSTYACANRLCAELAGYNNIDSYIGTTDYDWRCEAVEVADKIADQDKYVLENNTTWESFNILKFKNCDPTYYISNKRILRDQDNNILGVLFIGTIINDMKLMRIFNANVHQYVSKKFEQSKCTIYPVLDSESKLSKLTIKENECLFYYLRGLTSKETARLMNISPRTVEVHISNIKHKFSCTSRANLIEKSVNEGYIFHLPRSIVTQCQIGNLIG